MKKLFLIILSSVIAVMSIGCMKKTFSFHQEVAEITSVEIVEAQSSKEFTVKCSLSSDEIDDFIVQFKKIKFADLKEQLGHKPFEVIMGMLLGITLALLFEICIF